MTTTTERQSRRRQKLNQIAQGAGYETWGKYETSVIQRGKIEMNARPQYEFEITYIDDDGETKTKRVTASNEFQAQQVAGVFNKVIISIVNNDL